MRIPESVRGGLRKKLWKIADDLDWSRQDWKEKATQYEAWVRSPEVGGLLSNYMDQRQVRVYIKDTIMKGYVRSRLADPKPVLRVLGLLQDGEDPPREAEEYERPHGRRFADGRVIVWSKAKDWKTVLMVTHERAHIADGATPYAAVLFSAAGQFAEVAFREMVEDAATKLDIERVVWLA